MRPRPAPAGVVGSFAAFAAFAVFAVLLGLVLVGWAPVVDTDRTVEDAVHRFMLGHPTAVTAARAATAIGTYGGWAVLLAPLVGWLCVRRRWVAAVSVVLTAVSSAGLNEVVKELVRRPRPHLAHPLADPTSWSFPSGHAQAAAVGVGLYVVVLGRRWLAPAIVLAAAVGTSRIALGVHYLSDVLAGYALGLTWLLLVVLLAGRATAAQAAPR